MSVKTIMESLSNQKVMELKSKGIATDVEESVNIDVDDDKVEVTVDTEDTEKSIDDYVEDQQVDDIQTEEFIDDEDDDGSVVTESLRTRLKNIRARKECDGSCGGNCKKKRVLKRKNTNVDSRLESLADRDPDDLAVSVCPICGSKDFDQSTDTCPICGEDVHKYITKSPDEVENLDDGYTSIEIDGEDRILIDDEGNTVIEQPDIVNDVLEPNTHELVIDGDEEDPITIDSGVATFVGDTPAMESEDPITDEDSDKVAYLRIDQPIDEVADILTEDNANSVERHDDEAGYILTAKVDTLEEVSDEEVEEVTEDDDVVDNNEKVTVDIALEELPDGTLIHIDEVDNVDDLVEVINELLPEDVNINTAEPSEELEEVEDTETEEVEDEEEPEDDKVVESGFMNIRRNGRLESFRCKVVRPKSIKESDTYLAGKDRAANAKSNITTVSDETNIKEMSVLERRKAIKESDKIRNILSDLGVPADVINSDKGTKLINELVKVSGNIKEYKSGIKPTDGTTTTMESATPRRVKARKK